MTRVLRSAVKKGLIKNPFFTELSISKKSKTIKKSDKKKISSKGKENNQSDIWNINSITSDIFAYSEFRDLVNFNTVCKRWNNVTNPIIHKTIKLNRKWDTMKQTYGKRASNAAKIDEVDRCISYNAKYAPFVKEFKYDYKLGLRRTFEVFETFRYICNLTIGCCEMSQDQFLGMISPLTQLQELTLNGLSIKTTNKKQIYEEPVQLPSSLKKLRLQSISLIDNSELFVQTINSHSDLVEFSTNSSKNNEFLEPFYKCYLSLLNFELYYNQLQSPQPLFTIFQNNPQLINLNLTLGSWSSKIVSCISSYLINLEQLKLYGNSRNDTDVYLKFSQPTKIKKLNLNLTIFTNYSIDSILLNCPHLEELDLQLFTYNKQPYSVKFLNISKSYKLKKLSVNCDALSEGVFDSILSNCPNLNELSIILPYEWKEVMKSIYKNCDNLQRLDIRSNFGFGIQRSENLSKELYKAEFFTSNLSCKSTLTHLTLSGFKAIDSKSEYFKNFKILKSIRYPNQFNIGINSLNQATEINKNLWSGYRLLTNGSHYCDIELKRNLIN